MNNVRVLSSTDLLEFQKAMVRDEKSKVTIDKYLRDAKKFIDFAAGKCLTKELTVSYKAFLQEQGYTIRSINSMLAALNRFLQFIGREDCKVKNLRQQRQTYCAEERELTKEEYIRLLEAAKGKQQLSLLMQTICSTGIRISELKYFTVESVRLGRVLVRCKSKTRTVFVPGKLKKLLLRYAKNQLRSSGPIFVTRTGNPLDRSNIWAQMKKLCQKAGVAASKVFPHNLRKLFARTFYGIEKDLSKLADILGHSSVETTRIYIMTSGSEHRQKIERLGLII